jgi:hypothetical protein
MGFYKRVYQGLADGRRVASRRARRRFHTYQGIVDMCSIAHMFDLVPDDVWLFGVMCMSKVTDSMVNGRSAPTADAATDPAFAVSHPTVWAFLSSQEVINGKPRKTSTMITVCEEGLVKLGLRDRDNEVSLWVSGPSMKEAFDALEKALTTPPVAWRRAVDASSKSLTRQKT